MVVNAVKTLSNLVELRRVNTCTAVFNLQQHCFSLVERGSMRSGDRGIWILGFLQRAILVY